MKVLAAVCQPVLTCIVCISQAFLEMGTEEAAITMVNYYSTVTPHVRNVPVFIQYSNHKELKTDAGNQVRTPQGSPDDQHRSHQP